MAPATTFVGYAPSLVYSYGYDRLKSNALVTIGVWLLLCTTVAWGYLADKLGRRGPMVTSGLVILWGFTVCFHLPSSFCRGEVDWTGADNDDNSSEAESLRGQQIGI